jgi:hypothetical protein
MDRHTSRGTTHRKPVGEPLDSDTRDRLRAYVVRAHWRPACAVLAIDASVVRRALAGGRLRVATVRAIRLVLDTQVRP